MKAAWRDYRPSDVLMEGAEGVQKRGRTEGRWGSEGRDGGCDVPSETERTRRGNVFGEERERSERTPFFVILTCRPARAEWPTARVR